MTQPRSTLISLESTPWYDLVNRCVRRVLLCGVDSVSGNRYEHHVAGSAIACISWRGSSPLMWRPTR